ncbi:hypothetical protein P4571_11805 [Niallia alba]|uniref:ABC transporter permease n=1 Tax=Niallia alba TaxID=2729105 RepID=UPI002E1CB00F|nr:hypothetical protein [Niallia alba]
MNNKNFAGTGILFKLFLHRDRFLLPIWIFLPVVLILIVASTFSSMGGEGLENVLLDFDNDPLVSAILGPVMSFDLTGAIVWRGTSQIALTLGLGSLFTLIRHTRVDEETGRSELIRSYVTGTYASLTAALTLTIIGNLIAGILIAITIIFLGGSITSSLLYAITIVTIGCFFAGISGVAVQLRESSGSARGISITVLGLGILLSILNNTVGADSFLNWITPMAWQRLTQPFAGDNWIYLIYFIIICALPMIISYVLTARRDLGEGIFIPRSGPKEASPRFSSPLALAWRLQKKNFFGWIIATVLYIVVFAAFSPSLSKTEGMSGWLSNLGGTNWVEDMELGYVFISIGIYLMALFVGIYAITTVFRLKKEENEGRIEMLLDKQVSRTKLMRSHLIVAYLFSATLLLVMGIAGGLAYGIASGDLGGNFGVIFSMSVSKIPPVWIFVGLSALLYGLFPRISEFSWVIWISCSILELTWEAKLIDWSLMSISPYAYAHYTIQITELPYLSLFLLIVISLLFTTIGLLGFKNRNVQTKA